MQKSFLFAHHTGDASPGPQFDKVNQSHKNKGFKKSKLGFYVGYMYFAGRDGTVKQARKEDEMGAHTLVAGKRYNQDGIGFCFAGNFLHETPSKAQLTAWEEYGTDIVQRWNIPWDNILNHRDVKATACPGFDFAAHLKAHMSALANPAWIPILSYEEQLKRALLAYPTASESRKRRLDRKIARLKGKLGI